MVFAAAAVKRAMKLREALMRALSRSDLDQVPRLYAAITRASNLVAS